MIESVGRYKVETGPRARDAFGVLYAGTDPESGGRVYIKELRGGSEADSGGLESYQGLLHENLILPLEEIRQGQARFIVVPRPEGELLGEALPRLRRSGLAGRQALLQIAAAAARGLELFHRSGLVHGHVSPASIQASPVPPLKPVLLCFGPAERRPGHLYLNDNPNLLYVSRERLRGGGDHADDIYALGMLLYAGFAKAPPFPADSPYDLAEQILWGECAAFEPEMEDIPEALRPIVGPDLQTVGEIALKALNKDPRARYAMIGDLARVLETLVLRLSAVELGIRLYHDRRFEAAALVLEEAAKGPDPLRAWIYLGKTYGEGLQDYEKGMVAFRRALKENPELVMAKEGLADHYARFGHFTLAKKEILDLLAKNADNVLLHFRYGTILRQEHDAAAAKGDLKAAQAAADSALNVFRKTRSLNPYFLPAYIQAVRLERERGKTAEAEAECREVLDVIAKVIRFGNLNPAEVAAVYLEWARLTLLRRMPERAVVWARKAVEAWPRHGESHTLLAELYLEAGEQEKAVPHLLAALALSGNQKSILERLSRLMNRPPGAST